LYKKLVFLQLNTVSSGPNIKNNIVRVFDEFFVLKLFWPITLFPELEHFATVRNQQRQILCLFNVPQFGKIAEYSTQPQTDE
jgi:hypothetical protein